MKIEGIKNCGMLRTTIHFTSAGPNNFLLTIAGASIRSLQTKINCYGLIIEIAYEIGIFLEKR